MTTPRLLSRNAAEETQEGPRASESFLVRLWKEPASGETSAPLRGSARQLRTGEERFFKSLTEMSQHLLTVLGVVTAAGGSEDEDEVDRKADSGAGA